MHTYIHVLMCTCVCTCVCVHCTCPYIHTNTSTYCIHVHVYVCVYVWKVPKPMVKIPIEIIKTSFKFCFKIQPKNIFFNKKLDLFSSKIKNQSEIDFVKNRSMYWFFFTRGAFGVAWRHGWWIREIQILREWIYLSAKVELHLCSRSLIEHWPVDFFDLNPHDIGQHCR
jgi:hypothetical protein